MAYIDYEYFHTLYPDISEADFNRLSWEACRKMDTATTGIDGVRKLSVAFPVDEYAVECVKRCASKIVYTLVQIEQAEKSASAAKGYVELEDGTVMSKLISSRSSGNESISYATGNAANTGGTLIDKALTDSAVQERLFSGTIEKYLSSVPDANGVNLLFMGRYPYRIRKRE